MLILRRFSSLSPAFVSLLIFLALLWIAGGASRADVMGQSVVRGGASLLLVIAILFFGRFRLDAARPVLFLLIAMTVIVLAQLIPLPPELWQSLPGRAVLTQLPGQPVWRPSTMVPDATVNAAASLIIPFAALLLAAGIDEPERSRLPMVLLAVIAASMLLGLLQFSGNYIDSPFINDSGSISGSFANRNHFALFMAMGCLIAPVWAFMGKQVEPWRGPLALGLVVLFLLLILASGSRAGMLLGVLGIGFGLLLVRQGLQRAMRRAPRWAMPASIVAMICLIGIFVFFSIAANRAQSVNRVMTLDVAEDMRAQALPTLFAMLKTYFPLGSGFGGFDRIFRIHEPFSLLKPTYFNHAHNDFLEVLLDGGLPALLVLLAALGWWAYATFRVWRRPASSSAVVLGRLGSVLLLLVCLASIVDYPARTPMVMAIVTIAALLLNWGVNPRARPALPE